MRNKNAAGELMLHKTRGLVFSTTDYRETSIVVRIYTELFGVQSYIVNSVRKKNARIHANIFQPLTPVDLVVYHKERHGIQRISEIRPYPPLKEIPFDIVKTSIVLFLNEVLCKCIREEESNPVLFEYVFNSMLIFDLQQPVSKDFHLLFLVRLCRYLGFYPIMNHSEGNKFFNLSEGSFQSSIPLHPYYLDERPAANFSKLILHSVDLSANLSMQISEKRILLENVLEYFRLHVEGFGIVKSHKVLEQLFE